MSYILNGRRPIGGERIETKDNPGINRGDGETSSSYRERLVEYLSRIEWQSEGHRMWYTHKNPYGCWICELLQVARLGIDIHVDEARISDDEGEND